MNLLGTEIRAAEEQQLTAHGKKTTTSALGGQEAVKYAVDYFSTYNPLTALDMVKRVPGFTLDDGRDTRGFGGAAGNILIDGRRPSTKQDLPSDLLDRIPASKVAYVELIRSRGRRIDLRGRSAVVNVVLRDEVGAVAQWQFRARHNFDFLPTSPKASISWATEWTGISLNAGISSEYSISGDHGTEDVYDANGILIESRADHNDTVVRRLAANLNASVRLGDTLLNINTDVELEDRDELTSRRVPESFGSRSREELFGLAEDVVNFELGLDAERKLRPELVGTVIALFARQETDSGSSQRVIDATDRQLLLNLENSGSVGTEAIGRLELDWLASADHVVQGSLEVAKNVLDSVLDLSSNTGSGPVNVVVPSANTRVEEIRWNVLLKDSWSLGPRLVLDYGLGAETSTISQTGDVNQKRSFAFIKPHAMLSLSPDDKQRIWLRVEREVSQLDFEDFITATDFEDDRLDLGNPNLGPENTWIAELGYEKRFSKRTVVKVTAFNDWISDVQDLLPVTPDAEVPGNIGDGRRWGIELAATMPLDVLGLSNAQLESKARWQDSSVEDPVTGQPRVLSSGERAWRRPLTFDAETQYAFSSSFRQDFSSSRVAWGWDVRVRDERPRFKVNELVMLDEGVELNVFVETTRWLGLKIRLEAVNVLNMTLSRDRIVFARERDISPVASRLRRRSIDGPRAVLRLSGAF